VTTEVTPAPPAAEPYATVAAVASYLQKLDPAALDDAITAATEMAAAHAERQTNMTREQQMAAALEALRVQMGVATDAELPAAVATMKQQSSALTEVTRQRDEAVSQLQKRDEADAKRERAAVLQKHTRRGALTEAMLADAEYMATLAGLSAAQLDTNLSRLPVVAHARVESADRAVEGAGAKGAPAMTQMEKDAARAAGLSDEEFITARDSAQKAKQ
jgi:hypothetical protein